MIMSLKNMTLLQGATIALSGGTQLTFADNGVSIPNGLQLIATADSDYQTRRSVTVKYRPATLDPTTGFYGKDKKSITLARPVVLDDGRVVFNTVRIEREMHPSCTESDAMEMNKISSQFLLDEDLDNFWKFGSLA
jgi:hypothetical protein